MQRELTQTLRHGWCRERPVVNGIFEPPSIARHGPCMQHHRDDMATQSLNRVARACERCRRNKIRCDPFRPCALCTRSGSQCISDGDVHDVLPVQGYRQSSSPVSNPKRRRMEQSHPSPVAIEQIATQQPRRQSAETERAGAAITIARNVN